MADPTAVCLRPLLAGVSVDSILGAVRDRVHVSRRAADGIACGGGKGSADQNHGGYFLEHICPPLRPINADGREGLHSATAIFTKIIDGAPLDSDRCGNVWVRIVILEEEVVGFVIE